MKAKENRMKKRAKRIAAAAKRLAMGAWNAACRVADWLDRMESERLRQDEDCGIVPNHKRYESWS